MSQTSTSDNNTYPEVCLAAANDDTIFDSFKRNSGYTPILEHVCHSEGEEYYKNIKNKDILNNIQKFTINDKLGNPIIYNYTFGSFSPTTLRYIKVLSDLSEFSLNDKTIVEIGAGYGGQYTVLRQMFKPKKYIFVDLQPTLLLIKKYITKLELNDIELEL
jgi:putative sugar O-methyltransferase